jgi:hypothetical protein
MAGYTVERDITIAAPSHLVQGLVRDFHQWPLWSPWEDLDPDLQRTYTGPDTGVGSRYSWTGNRKAGAGSMEMTRVTPEQVDITVEFQKPIKATNSTTFVFESPTESETRVLWRMSGEHRGLMGLMGRLMSMDRMIGPDFEKGLARLKAVAEETAA